ncbi:MAG: 3-hydroxy-5-phosphonooxypentane-2,4-dione thiolase LsrF, partial [archaeon]|nr:3-hydroxy-5-phosphonooxypentane-2,4-dione thiolase LsrF [archaeon]
PKLETELDVFQLVHDALETGAIGVDMGRNIWQHDYPIAMIKAIRAIVHEGATTKEAHELFNSLKQSRE